MRTVGAQAIKWALIPQEQLSEIAEASLGPIQQVVIVIRAVSLSMFECVQSTEIPEYGVKCTTTGAVHAPEIRTGQMGGGRSTLPGPEKSEDGETPRCRCVLC